MSNNRFVSTLTGLRRTIFLPCDDIFEKKHTHTQTRESRTILNAKLRDPNIRPDGEQKPEKRILQVGWKSQVRRKQVGSVPETIRVDPSGKTPSGRETAASRRKYSRIIHWHVISVGGGYVWMIGHEGRCQKK